MKAARTNPVTSVCSTRAAGGSPRREYEVTASPIDDVLDRAGIEQVDLLKMDIEGAEGRAFAGLQRALADRRIKFLILEMHPNIFGIKARPREQSSPIFEAMDIALGRSITPRRLTGASPQDEMDITSVLTPLGETRDLGSWPHLLWA